MIIKTKYNTIVYITTTTTVQCDFSFQFLLILINITEEFQEVSRLIRGKDGRESNPNLFVTTEGNADQEPST